MQKKLFVFKIALSVCYLIVNFYLKSLISYQTKYFPWTVVRGLLTFITFVNLIILKYMGLYANCPKNCIGADMFGEHGVGTHKTDEECKMHYDALEAKYKSVPFLCVNCILEFVTHHMKNKKFFESHTN